MVYGLAGGSAAIVKKCSLCVYTCKRKRHAGRPRSAGTGEAPTNHSVFQRSTTLTLSVFRAEYSIGTSFCHTDGHSLRCLPLTRYLQGEALMAVEGRYLILIHPIISTTIVLSHCFEGHHICSPGILDLSRIHLLRNHHFLLWQQLNNFTWRLLRLQPKSNNM